MKMTALLLGVAATFAAASLSVAQTTPTDGVRLAQATPPAGTQPSPPAAQPIPSTPPAGQAGSPPPAQPASPPPAAQPTTPPAAQPTPPPAAAQPTPPPAPATPPATKTTGMAAWATLVGNTVTGKLDGKEYADYYLSDGTVKSMVESQIVTGKWALEGDKVCFTYPGDPKECYSLEVTGDAATFTDAAGVGIRGQVLKGNAKNL